MTDSLQIIMRDKTARQSADGTGPTEQPTRTVAAIRRSDTPGATGDGIPRLGSHHQLVEETLRHQRQRR